MPILEPIVKHSQVQYTPQRKATVSRCVHCYQPLGKAGEGLRRGNKKERHECAESLLAKQPATPAPFN